MQKVLNKGLQVFASFGVMVAILLQLSHPYVHHVGKDVFSTEKKAVTYLEKNANTSDVCWACHLASSSIWFFTNFAGSILFLSIISVAIVFFAYFYFTSQNNFCNRLLRGPPVFFV